MNATLVRRILGLILTALLLVGIFVLAATSAAAHYFHDASFGNFAEAYRSGFSNGYRDGYGGGGIG
jgi:branched-subunit amino acid permease